MRDKEITVTDKGDKIHFSYFGWFDRSTGETTSCSGNFEPARYWTGLEEFVRTGKTKITGQRGTLELKKKGPDSQRTRVSLMNGGGSTSSIDILYDDFSARDLLPGNSVNRFNIGNNATNCIVGIGEGLETKVNLIVGANSEDQVPNELEKMRQASDLGVHTIIDLSMARLDKALWQIGQEEYSHIAFGKVAPILVALENNGEVTPGKLLDEIKWSVEGGIDYMTLNVVPTHRKDIMVANDRAFPTTSRQGGVLLNYMLKNGVDNPYEEIMDEMIAMFKENNVTIHIGSTFRPSGVSEAYDTAHKWELKEQLEMYQRFREAGVNAIVEPMSHQPLADIGKGFQELREEFGGYIPFQMLGPIVTEVNYDSDQYASAIGAAEAARYNVGKVTTIPPREHVGFPTLSDSIEGMKATLTAVHAGDMARLPYLIELDKAITHGRGEAKSCNPDSKVEGCNKCLSLCPLLVKATYDTQPGIAAPGWFNDEEYSPQNA